MGSRYRGITKSISRFKRALLAAAVGTLTLCIIATSSAHAFDAVEGVIPKPDAYADLMLHAFPKIAPETCAEHRGHFSRPVPRIIHQVAADNTDKEAIQRASPWVSYAQQMGYTFEVWSPDDLVQDRFSALKNVREAMQVLQREGRRDAAEQLLELAILGERGGIFVSVGAKPPQLKGKPVDLDQVVNLRGLSVATSLRARDIGHMSIYLTHSFMAAPAHHPWMQAMAPLAATNAMHLLQAGHAQLPARYLCGNAFLSRNLYGSFNVLLFTYLQSLGIFPFDTQEGSLDALD